ncbi:hypothetical protein M514_04267 [Trichuris suis]|uniref:Uncharacterized protein n=1 Tax=Trichuris suis TaxID=68888 RepID=A0A085MC87_9BILA|nr:hypothetical protein M513_04267 [Trichuris suis]KFD71705.1 hypothetical protein M514_04267 [Trichuris suis]
MKEVFVWVIETPFVQNVGKLLNFSHPSKDQTSTRTNALYHRRCCLILLKKTRALFTDGIGKLTNERASIKKAVAQQLEHLSDACKEGNRRNWYRFGRLLGLHLPVGISLSLDIV